MIRRYSFFSFYPNLLAYLFKIQWKILTYRLVSNLKLSISVPYLKITTFRIFWNTSRLTSSNNGWELKCSHRYSPLRSLMTSTSVCGFPVFKAFMNGVFSNNTGEPSSDIISQAVFHRLPISVSWYSLSCVVLNTSAIFWFTAIISPFLSWKRMPALIPSTINW